MKYSNEELLAMYKTLALGRIYDEIMWEENQKGKLYSMFHFSIGQEAIGTAVAHAMDDKDVFMPSHRCRSLHLYRLDPYKYLSEQVGTKFGYNMGISGDPHLTSLEDGFVPNPGVLGQGSPIATGFAFALKYTKSNKVIVQLMGDGTFNQGAVYEAVNWAAVQKLPIVYVVENNAFAMSTLQSQYKATETFAERGTGVGVKSLVVDGNNLLEMRQAMDEAIKRAREESLPTLIEAVTYRRTGHYGGDTAPYRPEEFHNEMMEKHPDPIPQFENYLIEEGISTKEELDKIKDQITDEIRSACEKVYVDREDSNNMPTLEDIIKPEFTYASPVKGLI